MGLKIKIFIVALPFIIIALRKYSKGDYYEGDESMEGKTVIVTGANSGVGLGTCIGMAKRKAKVILACRNIKKGEAAIKKIRETTTVGELVVKHLDLASFKSIRNFAADLNQNEKKIDVLINNAGVHSPPTEKTEDGLNMVFGTNHFGHFLLTNLLFDKIKNSPKSRIITVSSDSHMFAQSLDLDDLNFEKENYSDTQLYSASKLSNCLFAKELGKRLEGTDVGTYCLTPGFVATEMVNKFFLSHVPKIVHRIIMAYVEFFHKDIWEGAQTSIYCAVAKEQEGIRGRYYRDMQESNFTSSLLNDEELAKQLWEISEKVTGLKK